MNEILTKASSGGVPGEIVNIKDKFLPNPELAILDGTILPKEGHENLFNIYNSKGDRDVLYGIKNLNRKQNFLPNAIWSMPNGNKRCLSTKDSPLALGIGIIEFSLDNTVSRVLDFSEVFGVGDRILGSVQHAEEGEIVLIWTSTLSGTNICISKSVDYGDNWIHKILDAKADLFTSNHNAGQGIETSLEGASLYKKQGHYFFFYNLKQYNRSGYTAFSGDLEVAGSIDMGVYTVNYNVLATKDEVTEELYVLVRKKGSTGGISVQVYKILFTESNVLQTHIQVFGIGDTNNYSQTINTLCGFAILGNNFLYAHKTNRLGYLKTIPMDGSAIEYLGTFNADGGTMEQGIVVNREKTYAVACTFSPPNSILKSGFIKLETNGGISYIQGEIQRAHSVKWPLVLPIAVNLASDFSSISFSPIFDVSANDYFFIPRVDPIAGLVPATYRG